MASHLHKLGYLVPREAYLQRSGAAEGVKFESIGPPWYLTYEEQTHVKACSTLLAFSTGDTVA